LYLWGFQFEKNTTFPTSYIPSLSNSTTTRSADVCQITGGDFSSFWNASEGSVAAEFDTAMPVASSNFPFILEFDNGSTSVNRISHYSNGTSNKIDIYVVDNSGSASTLSSGSFPSANISTRTAGCFKLNDLALTVNGGAVVTDSSQNMPIEARLSVGSSIVYGSYFLNGHIARLRYFNKRLTDKQLEDLCRPEDQLKLDLKFSDNLSLTPVVGPTPSFSRASTGSYFDSTGTLRYAVVNVLTNSENITGTGWSGAHSSRLVDQTVSPDGRNTADKLTTTGLSTDFPYWGQALKTVSGPNCFSVYFKYIDSPWIVLNFGGGVSTAVWFNIQTGSVGNAASGYSGSIQNIGNGWYRCSVTGTPGAGGDCYICGPVTGNGSATNNVGGSVFIWGAQLEAGSVANGYVSTTSSANSAPRFDHTYDGTSWISKGLLIEEQRTNTALYSSDIGNAYWGGTSSKTANFGISPDGTQNAARITGGGYFQSGGISKLGAQTFSFWAKTISGNSESINAFLDGGATTTTLTITGSWVRYSVTQTFGSTNTGTIGIYPLSASILFYGPQLELGAFPTSYIPTTTTSVVRSADVCQITGADFSGFYNQSEGSFAIDADSIGYATGGSDRYLLAASSSGTAFLANVIYPAAGLTYDVYNSTVQARNIYTQPNAGTLFKLASCYRANDFASSLDGASVVTDTSGTVPPASQLGIGYFISFNQQGNCHISRLRYYAIRLPNRLLIAKSQ
jgi:hypothetical protein